LQGVALAKLRQEALRQLQSALGALEDAVQQPLDGAGPLPPLNKGKSAGEVPR
jgi:hypothetical protein